MNKKVVVNNKMQKGYTYFLTEKVGKNFHPDFKPDLTPREMLELGIFGGLYFGDKPKEYPKSWFAKAKISKDHRQHKELNFFKVNASQPLAIWRDKNWISKEDPRGWFEWYCRYYLGRRLEKEDDRQIKRWNAIRRHLGALVKNCRKGDVFCRPRQRQALLHWGYDTRKI